MTPADQPPGAGPAVPPSGAAAPGVDGLSSAAQATAGATPAAAAGGSSGRRVDSLMRCLLYVAQLLGRPVSEAEVRALVPVGDKGLDERAFLLACERIGFKAARREMSDHLMHQLPTPCVMVGAAGGPSYVVERGEDGQFRVLDVVESRSSTMEPAAVAKLAQNVILLKDVELEVADKKWRGLLWGRIRPVLLELLVSSLVINILALATPLFMLVVFNRIIGSGNPDTLIDTMTVLMIGMAVAYVFDFLLRCLRGYTASHTGARIDALLSGEVVRHLVHLPYRHFEKTPSGVISERLRQLDVLRSFFTGQMPSLVIDLGFVFIYIAVCFLIDYRIGWIVVGAIPLFVLLSLMTHRAQRGLINQNFVAQAAKTSTLTETVNNAATIKALGLESEIEKRWRARVAQSAWTGFRANNLANIVTTATGVLQLVVSLVIIMAGTILIVNQSMTIGSLIAANMLASRALAPMRQVVSAWHTIQAVFLALRRIDELMSIEAELQPGTTAPMPAINGEIVFDRVTFKYDEDSPPVLHEIDLTIEAGSVIGIIGPSGSGKTTIANLLQGLYKPNSGRILIDRTDLQHYSPAQLRAQVGTVPQEVQLFAGPVRENIAMGVPDKDPGRIVAVAKFVGAHNFITKLAQGYNTVLSERGGGLSVGQRQLICIARALIRNPRIIVLDEATSALDAATEEQLLRTLRANARGRTIVMVTHRLAPLSIADKVALVIDGRVERFGPPVEVMAYARIRMAEAGRGQPVATPAGTVQPMTAG